MQIGLERNWIYVGHKIAFMMRGRKDHWLPQGYLRGFIAPSRAGLNKPLWCFFKDSQMWVERSTTQVAHGKGFYDYADATDYSSLDHPDSVFARLEREFPTKREEMRRSSFTNWAEHKQFLLEFMQMIRARSPLAMDQQRAQMNTIRGAVVKRVIDDRTLEVDSLELRPLPEQQARNGAIARMLMDCRAGADWMNEMHWCLRYSDSEASPFCTNDQALFVKNDSIRIEGRITKEQIMHPDTLAYFALSWDACLLGSTQRFDESYALAHETLLSSVREDQKQNANRFVISPIKF